ncbi:(d)CMP kinase [Spiroplasma taiwanense]|uniref:Cytidylate kinase n=1 Tax=Spiroplasma taiwanense CT-1 TaxID=1276220 RepID=S5LZ29_9MOLU|nr:(d)CMP kinase [Spiroplasma taiwanense]AGR40957.1 cytidylate kinase [Spiroplasma taiwanense CT-1]
MLKKINIAVDGTAGSGKSSVMNEVAKVLKMNFIDTGVIYRAFTKFCVKNNINFFEPKEIESQIDLFSYKYINENEILVNGEDYGPYIFDYDVVENIKYIAQNVKVREYMVNLQRQMVIEKNNIVIGRDITTVVLPDAELKIYFDCSVEARAKRRFEQNIKNNILPNVYEDILRQIKQRDDFDKNRSTGPLKIDKGAWILDTSNLTFEESMKVILNKIEQI